MAVARCSARRFSLLLVVTVFDRYVEDANHFLIQMRITLSMMR